MNNNNNLAIGVFDSGMGGLSVLRALRALLPNESFIYLGDMARLPYGTKSPETVKQYAIQMAKILVEREIKALVVACNTATTAALPCLQAMLPDMPVLGVVEPGASQAVRVSQNQQIFVMATETTIAHEAYQRNIAKLCPEASIYGQACSLLVALAEEGMVDNDIAIAALKHYLQHLNGQDTVVLGCTHFPIFKSTLQTILGPSIHIVDSGDATASALYEMLAASQLLATKPETTTHYLVTDSIERFKKVGPLFLGHTLDGASVELVDV